MHDVDSSELGDDILDAVIHSVLIGHIDDPAAGGGPGCAQITRGVEDAVVHVEESHRRTLCRKSLSARPADPSRSAGDDGDLPLHAPGHDATAENARRISPALSWTCRDCSACSAASRAPSSTRLMLACVAARYA
jgi:hypothetical protein